MQKHLLKRPEQKFEKVLDIIQFGSSILYDAEPNDIDIAVLYEQIPLKEQLITSQRIKKSFETQTSIPIHINSYSYQTLLDQGNFAKESIISGISLFSGDFFAKKLNLIPEIHIFYSLLKLDKAGKVRFNYFLHGKSGKGGFLTEEIGRLVKPGYVILNPLYEKVFFKKIKEHIDISSQKYFRVL